VFVELEAYHTKAAAWRSDQAVHFTGNGRVKTDLHVFCTEIGVDFVWPMYISSLNESTLQHFRLTATSQGALSQGTVSPECRTRFWHDLWNRTGDCEIKYRHINIETLLLANQPDVDETGREECPMRT
jgi:hypothetical protein